VVASQDDTTRIWDAETGKELHQFLRHSRGSDVAIFSPDGKKIITVGSPSGDYTIRIWDVESGKEVQTLTGYSPFPSVAFSPDGTKVVVASGNKNAQIWNAETGRMLRTLSGHMGGVNVASFSPDGKKVVTGCEEGTVRIWDAESGNEIRQLLALPRVLSPSKTGGDPQNIQFVAFSPDGKRIVATSGPTAHVLDAVTGRELQKLETTFHVVPVFSPDGKKIVTVSNDDNTARIWNLP
jgi:WD40 repeat protein